MRFKFIILFLSIVLLSCTEQSDAYVNKLNGTWNLKIENLEHEVVTKMFIRFSQVKADSCLGGDWKKVVVKSYKSQDLNFFPRKAELSYQLENGKLTIGRNRFCDAYLHLSGELNDFNVSGEYFSFGWGTEQLGYFTLVKNGNDGT